MMATFPSRRPSLTEGLLLAVRLVTGGRLADTPTVGGRSRSRPTGAPYRPADLRALPGPPEGAGLVTPACENGTDGTVRSFRPRTEGPTRLRRRGSGDHRAGRTARRAPVDAVAGGLDLDRDPRRGRPLDPRMVTGGVG